MKRTPKYVGLDVHQATTVIAVREESGRVIARSVVPTEATAILDFCRAACAAPFTSRSRRHAGPVAARSADPRAQSQSPPCAQERVERRGHHRERAVGALAGPPAEPE
jgi:hypothetical protein